jgi:hypothetical protein
LTCPALLSYRIIKVKTTSFKVIEMKNGRVASFAEFLSFFQKK